MSFDFIDDEPKKRKPSSGWFWNILTVLVLVSTLCMLCGFMMVFLNPQVGFNPFPPPTLPPTLSFPTPTATLPVVTLPPTWTPTPTITPTPAPSPTAVPNPTAIPSPTLSPTPYPYELQPGTPTYTSSKIFHSDQGCNWLSVAGQVLDTSGKPVVVNVLVRGELAGTPVELLTISGTAPNFGPGGYEIQLADHPIASNHTLHIQLLDPNGLPISPQIYFDTHDICDENIVLINFRLTPTP